MPMFQTVGQKKPLDRTDHVWLDKDDDTFKCLVCGAVTKRPPIYPTAKTWMPELGYAPLTEQDRLMVPPPIKMTEMPK